MKVVVLGATGATGRLVVSRLLSQGHEVRALVRKTSFQSYWDSVQGRERLTVWVGSVLKMSESELSSLVEGVQAVVSCLGHNLNFRGILLPPWKLVRDSLARVSICVTTTSPEGSLPRIILMGTTAVYHVLEDLRLSWGEQLIFRLIGALLPPQKDNVAAARWLQKAEKSQPGILPWVVVRPDTLVDSDTPSRYEVYPGTLVSPLLNPGVTSRINVADFMARLAVDEKLFKTWEYAFPVVYNAEVGSGRV